MRDEIIQSRCGLGTFAAVREGRVIFKRPFGTVRRKVSAVRSAERALALSTFHDVVVLFLNRDSTLG